MNKILSLTAGHTQLPGREVAHVGSFGYLSGNPTRKRLEAATAHTGERCTQVKNENMKQITFVSLMLICSLTKSQSIDILTYIHGCHGNCEISFSDSCSLHIDSIAETIRVVQYDGIYEINGLFVSKQKEDSIKEFIVTQHDRFRNLASKVDEERNTKFVAPLPICYSFEDYHFHLDSSSIVFRILDKTMNENSVILREEDLEIFKEINKIIK